MAVVYTSVSNLKMKKEIYIDRRAEKEIRRFGKKVRNMIFGYIQVLRQTGVLKYPYSKKVGRKLYEIRVRCTGDAYRVFYAYFDKKKVIVLHAFQKKTNRIPKRNLDTAIRRSREYL